MNFAFLKNKKTIILLIIGALLLLPTFFGFFASLFISPNSHQNQVETKGIADGFVQAIFYVCCLPAITFLSLISAIDLILTFFQENFSTIVFKNVKKEPLFIFFMVFMFAVSVLFVLYQITKVKFQAANPDASSQLRKTLHNFITSIIYMLIFPSMFYLGIVIINSISGLITNFLFHGHEQNWATIFLQLGITKNKWWISGGWFSNGYWVFKEQIILRGDFNAVTEQLTDYFWESAVLGFSNYNPLYGLFSSLAGLAIFAQLLFYLLGNFFQLMLGFLYSPFPIFKRPYDDGITFKRWKDMILKKMQTVILINLLLAFVIFILIFIHENKVGLPNGLNTVFELVATTFLVFYLRKFYCKMVEFIELKTKDDAVNDQLSSHSNHSKKTSFLNKLKGLGKK